MLEYELIKNSVITILSIYIIIVVLITIYNIYKSVKKTGTYPDYRSFKGFTEVIITIIIIILIVLNETINAFTGLGFIVLLIKGYISIINIGNIKYYDSNFTINFINNLINILNIDKLPDIIEILRKYIPLMILNGFLMMILYIYTVSKLKVDLSLALSCAKSNFNVEYSTLRHKVRTFAKEYDKELKKFLGILIFSFIFAIISISYIIYTSTIELYYILLLPILLIILIFAFYVITKIDGRNLGKDTTADKNKNDTNIVSIVLTVLIFPMVGLISVVFLV